MANLFKSLDSLGIGDFVKRIILSIRQFFATKTEMDVVATALTDLDQRIDEAMPTISVGKVTTVEAGKDADVKNVGTSTKAVLDFYIPRGEQGDMKELDDNGSDSCEVGLSWAYYNTDPNLSGTFVGIIRVPVPSVDAMVMDADCIKQINPLTLLVNDKNWYTWKELHWLLRCSNTENIVYTTKYATNDTSFPSVEEANPNIPPTIIEISVSLHKDKNLRYVQVTVENMFGRAYYIQKQ